MHAYRNEKATSVSNFAPGNIDEKYQLQDSHRTSERSNCLFQQQPLLPFPKILHPGPGKNCLSHKAPGRHGHILQGFPRKMKLIINCTLPLRMVLELIRRHSKTNSPSLTAIYIYIVDPQNILMVLRKGSKPWLNGNSLDLMEQNQTHSNN
jgi:hypothetical protein